ncbi:MAG TPA: hypothetical protein VHA73_14895 [Acidimicrobiales bacterium]|nr:hypothetical protein [Acidimicrobiales bacterium]
MLRDIRELSDTQEAYAAELRRRWGGLLSYRYLGRRYASMDVGPIDDTVVVRRDMRNATGGLLLAVIGICSPEGGGMSDLEAVPNPVVHSCQVIDPGHDVARIEVRSEVLKQGRQMGYSRSRIVDADRPERILALTEGQGISIGVPPAGLQKMDTSPIEVQDSPDLPPLWNVFGVAQRHDGRWELGPLREDLASPDAALHLGPQFVLMETAALDAAHAVADTDQLQGLSSHVMFLARGKTGPFRAEVEPIPRVGDLVGCRVTVHDEGAGDRPITSASYQFCAVA